MLEELTAISLIIVLPIILGILFTVFPFWNICKRVGLHPVLSILSLVPLANIAFLFYLAFAQWPSLDKRSAPDTARTQPNQKKSGKKILVSVGTVLLVLAPVIVIIGTTYTFTLPKIYAAQARIQISNDDVIPNPFEDKTTQSGYDPYFLRTQHEVIKSRPVLYEVINRLNLQEAWGTSGKKLPKEFACEILRSSLHISQFRDTSLVSIQAQRQNPKEAMRIANTLADVYRDQRLDLKRKEMTRALDALRHELEKQQAKVDAAEQRVETIRTELDLPAFTANGSQIEKLRLQQLEGDRIAARVEMLTQKARYEQMLAMSNEDLLTSSAYLASDPFVETMRTQIHEYDISLTSLLKNYGENHPEVKQTKAAKDELMAKLAQAVEGIKKGVNAQYIVAKAKFDALDQELRKDQNVDRDAQREKLLPFNRAKQELEIQRSIMNALEARLAQEGITLKIPRTPVEIIDAAKEPTRPISPNLTLNVLLSVGIAGIFFLTGLPMLIIGLKRA
ncbi:MAG: hypothetical protein JEZ10_00095 [Verrucomicrobia bacterium]|nr:hypothetical protein [Verrucomicrobiota bacterium]